LARQHNHPSDTPPITDAVREHIRRAENRAKIAAGKFTLADLDGLDYANVAETAAVFRADPRTIRARIEDGTIPALNLGEWRIPVAWLRRQAGVAA
jgi:hypothetical protein